MPLEQRGLMFVRIYLSFCCPWCYLFGQPFGGRSSERNPPPVVLFARFVNQRRRGRSSDSASWKVNHLTDVLFGSLLLL